MFCLGNNNSDITVALFLTCYFKEMFKVKLIKLLLSFIFDAALHFILKHNQKHT